MLSGSISTDLLYVESQPFCSITFEHLNTCVILPVWQNIIMYMYIYIHIIFTTVDLIAHNILTIICQSLQYPKPFDFSCYCNAESKVKDIIGNNFEFFDSEWTNEANLQDLMSHRLSIPHNNAMRLDPNLTRKNYPR